MTNQTLSYVLRNLKLKNCKFLKENIYYIRKTVKQMCYSSETGNYKPTYSKYEFLIIAEEGIKKP